MPHQATAGDVLRWYERTLRARGHWFEPCCATRFPQVGAGLVVGKRHILLCRLVRVRQWASAAYCLTSVPTVTCGQWMPLKSSITSCVYCSWCLSGWPPVPAIVSLQNVASARVALALPPGGLPLVARNAVLAVPPPALMVL